LTCSVGDALLIIRPGLPSVLAVIWASGARTVDGSLYCGWNRDCLVVSNACIASQAVAIHAAITFMWKLKIILSNVQIQDGQKAAVMMSVYRRQLRRLCGRKVASCFISALRTDDRASARLTYLGPTFCLLTLSTSIAASLAFRRYHDGIVEEHFAYHLVSSGESLHMAVVNCYHVIVSSLHSAFTSHNSTQSFVRHTNYRRLLSNHCYLCASPAPSFFTSPTCTTTQLYNSIEALWQHSRLWLEASP